jgi:hypothetical protein
MIEMARTEVTLREWADMLDLPVDTIRAWAKTRPDFPGETRRAGPTALYFLSELNAWRRKPANTNLGLRRGGNRRKTTGHS